MLDPHAGPAAKVESLKNAINAHKEYARDVSVGRGVYKEYARNVSVGGWCM